MRALILAGGKGTRLRPITHTSSKQLIPIANKPIIDFGLEAIIEAGIKDIGIIVGDTKQEIMDHVGDGSRHGVKITYIEQDKPLGLAHAVKISRDFLANDPFVMYLGDNLVMGGIAKFVKDFEQNSPDAKILVVKVPNPQDYGVASLDGKRVVALEEKPKKPKSDLALVGVYLFTKKIFDAVDAIKPSARGELEITDAIQYLIDQNLNVECEEIKGWWKDTGKLDDLLEANRIVLDTFKNSIDGEVDGESNIGFKVVIAKGAKVIRSNIKGPAILGENCVITDAYIGPFTSLGPDVEINGAEIENSIVLKGARILGITGMVIESLIGRDVEITKSNGKPAAHRLMLGDSSRMEVP